MRRMVNTLVLMAVLWVAFSCVEREQLEADVNESVVLDLSSGVVKAASEGVEGLVNHLDVFIFKAVSSGSGYVQGDKVYYGRYSVNNASSVTLDVKRSSFSEDDRFYVYLVANSTFSQDYMTDKVITYNDLQNLKQEDMYIHFTGLTGLNVETPEFFLMDALATQGTSKDSPVQLYNGVVSDNTVLDAVLRRAAAKVVINITAGDNVRFHNFTGDPESDGGKYYIRNLPYETYVLSGVDASVIEAKRRTTMAGSSKYFGWYPETSPKSVTLTAYVYPHHWTNASLLDHETCVIMNLPMIYKKGTEEEVEHKNSWYKIHMTDDKMFERNKYYHVDITLNAPGATSDSNPQVLESIFYAVEDWTSVGVEVGGENRPDYLQLNTDHVDMYNVNIDATTLKFASSSFIPSDGIELLEAYYYNYLDEKVDLETHSEYDVYDYISAIADANVLNGGITINSPFVAKSQAEIEAEILALGEKPVVPQEPVNPEVTEPDPQEIVERYNDGQWDWYKIKYSGSGVNVTFSAVSNSGGSTARRRAEAAQEEYDEAYAAYLVWNALSDAEKQVKIQKYQALLAEYNTKNALLQEYQQKVNLIQSSSQNTHSNAIRYLRFRVTNETGQTAEFTVSQHPTLFITNEHGHYSYRSDFGGTTYYSAGTNRYNAAYWSNGTWRYAALSSNRSGYLFRSKYYNSSQGDIDYYYWNSNGTKGSYEAGSLTNPRMYHVHVTSTSSLYVVAIPKLDENGYTRSSADNSRLVSPSFMIASQLGATQSPNSLLQAASHCAQYVEVREDGVEYDDWRLPTEAELEIIINHQYVSDAMAEVLAGRRYWCAYTADGNNYVVNTGSSDSDSDTAVRCVRDAY